LKAVSSPNLIKSLHESKVFRDYERAFSEATGLPVSLCPIDSLQIPHRGKKTQTRFCAFMTSHGRACATCLETQEGLRRSARSAAWTVQCPMGMVDSAVPVHLGEKLIGFLQTGQVFCKKPTAAQFRRVTRRLANQGVTVDSRLEESFFSTPVMTPKQYQSMVELLTIFAQHLSIVSNQVAVHQENAEPPMIARAKDFIRGNQSEDLSLGQVARAVNASTFYFCKMFKKATGLNFTEYLSRVRIEKAKNLLLNPNLRISEIAFEVGFQSLTHFNRVFKKIVGQSPTDYRRQLVPV
jgi:AraC-like DNA-binding protein/ligand-binding sensor protein